MSNIIFAILNSSDFKEDNVLYCGRQACVKLGPTTQNPSLVCSCNAMQQQYFNC